MKPAQNVLTLIESNERLEEKLISEALKPADKQKLAKMRADKKKLMAHIADAKKALKLYRSNVKDMKDKKIGKDKIEAAKAIVTKKKKEKMNLEAKAHVLSVKIKQFLNSKKK